MTWRAGKRDPSLVRTCSPPTLVRQEPGRTVGQEPRQEPDKNLEHGQERDRAEPDRGLGPPRSTHRAREPAGSLLRVGMGRSARTLPDRLPPRRMFGAGRLTRPLIAASMVVGLTAGAAAASPTVRHHMISVWQDVQHMVGMGDDTSVRGSQRHHGDPGRRRPARPGRYRRGRVPSAATGPELRRHDSALRRTDGERRAHPRRHAEPERWWR